MSSIPPTGPTGEEPQRPLVPPIQPGAVSQPPPSNPFAEGTTGPTSPFASPHAAGQTYPAHANQGDATGGMIPYKNPQALTAYYLGIFGMLPCVGIVFSLPAFVLGIRGLQARKRNPLVKGSVHAWIGIILGGLFSLLWGGGLAFALLAYISNW